LRQRGVAPGDRVALFLPNHPDYLVWLYAIWWAGAVAVPINAKLHPREAAWIVGNADARLLLTHSSQVDELQALRADMPAALQLLAHDSPDGQRALQGPGLALQARAPTDLAWLFYTSGTTGRPKGIRPAPPADPDPRSRADGLKITRDGWVVVATAMGVQILDQPGRVHLILPPPLGARFPSNLCFGGPELKTLYITAGDQVFRRETKLPGVKSWEKPVMPPKPKL
jgi:hypothetical protein